MDWASGVWVGGSKIAAPFLQYRRVGTVNSVGAGRGLWEGSRANEGFSSPAKFQMRGVWKEGLRGGLRQTRV